MRTHQNRFEIHHRALLFHATHFNFKRFGSLKVKYPKALHTVNIPTASRLQGNRKGFSIDRYRCLSSNCSSTISLDPTSCPDRETEPGDCSDIANPDMVRVWL